MANAYTVLGVSATATHDEIAAAFRARSVDHHPDRASNEEDRKVRTATMAKLTLAYRYVGDPERRAKYDRKLADLGTGAEPPGSTPAPPPDETIDVFLRRLRSSASDAEKTIAETARAAGIDDERANAAAKKGVRFVGDVADLIGLVRGFQR